MRLTCPNCGAQYEVPEEVIPEAGRDVQCSNCGDTWFQTRHPSEEPLQTSTPEEDGWTDEAPVAAPKPAAKPAAEPAPSADASQAEERPAPERRNLDPDVTNVLREEASREQQARAAEGGSLETQPDLGLAGTAPEDRRAQQARARMARLRGEDDTHPEAVPDPAAPHPPQDDGDDLLEPGTRRNLLPDIEDINSTIAARPEDSAADSSARDGTRTQPLGRKKKGGFLRGLSIAVILACVAVAPYVYAPQIKEAVPSIAASLDAYVETVDKGRVLLETQLGNLPDTLRALVNGS